MEAGEGGVQRGATWGEGSNEGECKQQRSKPEANTWAPTDTAASATEAPTKNTNAARTEHALVQTDWGEADRCRKGPGARAHNNGRQQERKGIDGQLLAHPQGSQSVTVQEYPERNYSHSFKRRVMTFFNFSLSTIAVTVMRTIFFFEKLSPSG
jgi:hypothetical protein